MCLRTSPFYPPQYSIYPHAPFLILIPYDSAGLRHSQLPTTVYTILTLTTYNARGMAMLLCMLRCRLLALDQQPVNFDTLYYLFMATSTNYVYLFLLLVYQLSTRHDGLTSHSPIFSSSHQQLSLTHRRAHLGRHIDLPRAAMHVCWEICSLARYGSGWAWWQGTDNILSCLVRACRRHSTCRR